MHSACEAYSNGAISETTYAIILSRFDKAMIAMLYGELAAGAFGRTLAGVGTGAEGHAAAALDFTSKIANSRQAELTAKSVEKGRDEAQAKLAEEKAKGATADPQKTSALERQVEESRKNVESAQRDLAEALKAETASAAKVSLVTVAGGITPSHSPEIAKTLAEMQRKYIENLNFDALEVVCMSALDRATWTPELRAAVLEYQDATRAEEKTKVGAAAVSLAAIAQQANVTPLALFCMTDVLPTIQSSKSALLENILERAVAEKHRAEMKEIMKEVGTYSTALHELLQQMQKP